MLQQQLDEFPYTLEFTKDWFVCPLRDWCIDAKAPCIDAKAPYTDKKAPCIDKKAPYTDATSIHNKARSPLEESRTLRKLTQPNTTVLVRQGLLLNQIRGTTVTCFADRFGWSGE